MPVASAYGVEYVSQRRAELLALGRNAFVVRAGRGGNGPIVRVDLESHGDDRTRPARGSNPQTLVHQGETTTNPPRVWEHKGLFRGRHAMPAAGS